MLTGSLKGDIEYQLRHGHMATKLILLNVAVFIVVSFFRVIGFFTGWDAVTALMLRECMASGSMAEVVRHPWSLLLYQFFHIQFFHLLFNMLWLYWFAEVFVLYQGEKRILPVYLLGGLIGWVLFALAMNFIPVLQQRGPGLLLGASAGIMAIVWAAVALHPSHMFNLLFIGPVKIVYVAAASLLVDFFAIADGEAGTYFAHLGGALLGFGYVKLLQSGWDIFSPIDAVASLFKKRSKLQTAHVGQAAPRASSRSTDDQKRADEILDKISRSGYDSLSKEEKDFLFKYSNKL